MADTDTHPLIVGFVSDLMFAVRIERVVEQLGFEVRWVERAEDLNRLDPGTGPAPAQSSVRITTSPGPSPSPAPRTEPLTETTHSPAAAPYAGRLLGEPLVGADSVLLDRLTRWRPALVLFDLGNREVPWRKWIALIKSVSATRRLPVVCFGSHVDVETMTAAREAGADAVLARSRFASDLPGIIQKWAHLPDLAALAEACSTPLLAEAVKGLEEFNRGEFFEAHESLETAWNEDPSPGRELYRAILQVAVAYLQIQRGNYRGAMKMFLRLRQWIDPLPDYCRGIDVAGLREAARRAHAHLTELGPERLAEFDMELLQPVRYDL